MTTRRSRVDELLRNAHDAGRFSGAACLMAVDDEIAVETYLGEKSAWTDDFAPIPIEQRDPVTPGTLFDLASVSKTFTAHTALAMADAGVVDLDARIGDVLPAYRAGARRRVTLRHLLAHTSGLPAEWLGWRAPLLERVAAAPEGTRFTTSPLIERRAELVDDLLSVPLETEPGEAFVYSCAGYNTTMVYLEELTGRAWPALLGEFTTGPLGLATVTARPDRAEVVATEYEPKYGRGVVRGDAHDGAAWSLGGHSANAGLFAAARDLLAFGQAILRGEGRVRGEWMWSGLGLRIGDPEWGAANPEARTHIGFTGTLLHLDRRSRTTVVLLTNRVHPSRDNDIVDLRREVVGAALAAA
jgi:CubicO group peptidase (beta-lactamase class C family)